MSPGYEKTDGFGEFLSSPPPFEAGQTEELFFLFWAGALAVAVCVPWALYRWGKRKDPLPLLMIMGGGLCFLGEPLLDILGHLRWASDLIVVYTNFGIEIPLLNPLCYMTFMGLEAYFVYSMIQRGITVKQFLMIFGVIGLSDAIMEYPGVLLDIYEYYGVQPFEFYEFPFWWSFANACAITAIGVLTHFVYPRLEPGWQRLGVLPLGLIGTWLGYTCAMPAFLAINADIPTWLQWAFGSGTIVLACIYARFMASLVCRPESEVDWTFRQLFLARFMLPHQRQRMVSGSGASSAAR